MKFMRLIAAIVAGFGLLLGWGCWDVARRQWLIDVELADGVRVVQTPFACEYVIRLADGSVLEDPFGWVVRPNCIYGSYGKTFYFYIRRGDLRTTRLLTLGELNDMLLERGLPRYHMNDEENVSHLKYGYRKYR